MNITNLLARTKLPASISAAALSVVFLAAAQESERPRRPSPQADVPRGERPQGNARRPGGFPEDLLSEEQRAQVRDFMEAHRERQGDLDEKTRQLRRELEEATYADQLDEKLIREKASALAGLESERVLIRAKAFAKIRPSLTPEQLEKIKKRRAELAPGRGLRSERPPLEQRPRKPEARPDQPDRPRAEARLRDQDRLRPGARPEGVRPPPPEPLLHQRGPERFGLPRGPEQFPDASPRGQFHRLEGPEFDRGQPEFRHQGPPSRFEPPRERLPRPKFRPENPDRYRAAPPRNEPEFGPRARPGPLPPRSRDGADRVDRERPVASPNPEPE